MNADDFEKQLRRQPLRQIPMEWREEIMDAARRVPDHQLSTLSPQPTSWWRELLWPCPQAWAGLAAVWAVIFVLNVASRDPVQVAKTSKAVPAPEILIALREHRRLLAELIGLPAPIGPPKPADPKPRGEISPRFIAV